MAPEHLAVGALHDAVVGIQALRAHDGGNAPAQALELVGAGVEDLEGLVDHQLARSAEHGTDLFVAVDHDAAVRNHQAHGRHLEGLSIIKRCHSHGKNCPLYEILRMLIRSMLHSRNKPFLIRRHV
ncbi:hypothetical protein D3C72_2038100 [compost metagenome]